MLSEELLTINKIVQAEIAVIDAIDWFVKLDKTKQREVVLLTRMCLEQAHPNQEGVDEIIDRGYLNITPVPLQIFKERHYDQAIVKASEVPDEELGNSFIAFIALFRHFDEIQLKTVCKNGCEHEWHNLTWVIRTTDMQKLVDFYSLLGLKFNKHKHGASFHYSAESGQSALHIFLLTKTQKNMGLNLHLSFSLNDFDTVVKTLKEKQVPFSAEPEAGFTAVVADPDGRKVALRKA